MTRKDRFQLLLILFLFFCVYFQVFIADYVFTDEANQIWHNHDGLNYTQFTVQGRWLMGLLNNKLFTLISTTSQLKYLRIFSLLGWILTVFLWYFIFSSWRNKLELDKRLVLVMNFYVTCCIPVAVCIGWTACLQLFISVGTALISSYLLFNSFLKNEGYFKIHVLTFAGSLSMGIISLFFYQGTFGIFLLPFFIYYLKKQTGLFDKRIVFAIVFYIFICLVYYLLFKYSLQVQEMHPVNRSGISTDVSGKLSFLFSDPLPCAFSLNILYTARSIFSQVLAPVMMVAWLITVFIRYKKSGFFNSLMRIVFVLFFLVLIYLPSMVVLENFASYRTLFALNLAVFYLQADQALFFLKKQKSKTIFIYSTCLFLLLTGFYNYNFQLVNPLKTEKKAFDSFMSTRLKSGLQTVYFIRADKFMFSPFFHTLPYKDEFGLPSANKDWVPEPLVKQYVLESTGNRSIAEKINVVQFADTIEYNKAKIQLSANDILIDMNKVFNNYLAEKK